jgi:hypothetical protein
MAWACANASVRCTSSTDAQYTMPAGRIASKRGLNNWASPGYAALPGRTTLPLICPASVAQSAAVGGPIGVEEGVGDGRGVICLTTAAHPGTVNAAAASPA